MAASERLRARTIRARHERLLAELSRQDADLRELTLAVGASPEALADAKRALRDPEFEVLIEAFDPIGLRPGHRPEPKAPAHYRLRA